MYTYDAGTPASQRIAMASFLSCWRVQLSITSRNSSLCSRSPTDVANLSSVASSGLPIAVYKLSSIESVPGNNMSQSFVPPPLQRYMPPPMSPRAVPRLCAGRVPHAGMSAVRMNMVTHSCIDASITCPTPVFKADTYADTIPSAT